MQWVSGVCKGRGRKESGSVGVISPWPSSLPLRLAASPTERCLETRAAAGWVDGRHFRYPVVRAVARTPHPRPAPPPPDDPANPLIPTTAPRSVCTTGGGLLGVKMRPLSLRLVPSATSPSQAERQHPSTLPPPHQLAGLTFTGEDSQVRELGFSQAVSPSLPRAAPPRSHSLWQLSLKKVPSRVAHVRLARRVSTTFTASRV